MALSKKKSRLITINDNKYRWSPSQDSGYIVLVIQNDSGKGKKLEVVISDDLNIVIENGNFSIKIGETNTLVITPSIVSKIISDARKLGWNPKELGTPVQLSFLEGSLIVRRGL